MGIDRSEAIQRMRIAFKAGLSQKQFFRDEKEAGYPTYRRTTMLGDWRTINQLEEKKELMQYVRKDRFPTAKIIATSTWDLSKEFMYVVRVKNQTSPDEPILEHNINIQTDTLLTPEMVIAMVIEERAKEERYLGEVLLEVIPFTVIRRVDE